jgi:hypothetical protein
MMRQLDTRLSSLQGEVWSIAQPSARMLLLALPLAQPHPPPSLNQRRLRSRMRSLQAVLQSSIPAPVSQWWASAFRAASSPTSAERSRAVSLTTSFGSCGPTQQSGGAQVPRGCCKALVRTRMSSSTPSRADPHEGHPGVPACRGLLGKSP